MCLGLEYFLLILKAPKGCQKGIKTLNRILFIFLPPRMCFKEDSTAVMAD